MKKHELNVIVKTHDKSINNLINLSLELKQLNTQSPVIKTISDGCVIFEKQHLLKIQDELTKIIDSLDILDTSINNY